MLPTPGKARPSPQDSVVAQRGGAVQGDRAAEPVGDLDSGPLDLGVGDDVALGQIVAAAVDPDAVGEHRKLDRVAAEGVVVVGFLVGPHGKAVVAGVAHDRVFHGHVRDPAMEVDAVGRGVHDAAAAHR
jgi:hypothetical protein